MKIHRYWPLILLGFSIVGLFNFCKLKEPLPTPPNDPTANFDADKYDCVAPCKIQFTNKSTGTGTLTYAWNFGDNIGTSTEANPSYTYATAGTYTITLTTSGTFGKATTTKQVRIAPLGSKPFAQFTYTVTNNGRATCAVTLTNTSLNATRFSWSFGDGSSLDTNRTPQPHPYTTVGLFPLKLTATNSLGESDDTIVVVTIKPTACFTVACNVCLAPSALASFDGSCSTNADTYAWNFDDPTSSNNTSTIQRPTHVFNTEGAYKVTLVVTKNTVSDTTMQTVTVKSFTKDTSFASLGPAKKILALPDGYMVLGNTTSGTTTNIYLLKVDLNLNIVAGFPKTLTTTGTNVAEGFVQLADGSFAIVGTAFNTANSTDDILYMRTNATGTLVFAPTLFGVGGFVANDKARNIIETPDGHVLIVGSTYNNVTATFDMFVVKKNINLSTTYIDKRLDGANDEVAFSAALLSNNAGFLIAGTTAATGAGKPTDVLFMKIDVNGGVTGQKPYGTATFYETVAAMVKNNAGNFMTVGVSTAPGFNNVHLVQVDAAMNALTNFPVSVSSTTSETARDLKEIPTGGYIIAGERNLDAFNGLVNAQGVAIGMVNTFGANGRDYFESIALANDGGFVFAGGKNGVLYLVKTNKNGAL
jgi:PKD repeat protein